MGTLTQTLTKEKLDNQREVVKNERRQSVDNQPYGTWLEKTGELLFPDSHPYHHSVIGSMTDLSAASVEDVQNFFKTYYAPNNAVLVVAGDIDVPQAKEMVRKYFGPIPRGPVPPKLASMSVPAIVGREQRVVVQDALAPAPAVFVAYRVPPGKDRRAQTVSLLSTVIGGGASSRLDESLVRKQQIATNVASFNFGLADGADVLVVIANGKPGSNPDSLERALLAELAGASSFTQSELDRARARARFDFVDALQYTRRDRRSCRSACGGVDLLSQSGLREHGSRRHRSCQARGSERSGSGATRPGKSGNSRLRPRQEDGCRDFIDEGQLMRGHLLFPESVRARCGSSVAAGMRDPGSGRHASRGRTPASVCISSGGAISAAERSQGNSGREAHVARR